MPPFCVCIPARNEAARIGMVIEALAAQSIPGPIRIALCVNNSDDGTADAARVATGGRIALEIEEHRFEPALAHAGSARRAAMDLGARLLSTPTGILISTDADCRPPAHWIAATIAACTANRIVGGRIELDEVEDMPPAIRAVRHRFDLYWAEVRAIEDAIDPVAWDPPPRHGDHTGASLALSVDLYRRAGGVPLLATGEDRALVEAAVAAGGELVHPPEVWTRASARTEGRAAGGMALDMARWTAAVDALRVPSFAQWKERATWRRALRQQAGPGAIAAGERDLPPMHSDMALPEWPA